MAHILPQRQPMRRARHISTEAWDNRKHEVYTRYIAQNQSLEKIMDDFRAEFDFDATKKQWKDQLGRWKFRKRLNKEDAAHILYLIRVADITGTPRTVYFNNTVKTKDDVLRYSRKSGLIKNETDLLQHLDLDERSPYITWQDEGETANNAIPGRFNESTINEAVLNWIGQTETFDQLLGLDFPESGGRTTDLRRNDSDKTTDSRRSTDSRRTTRTMDSAYYTSADPLSPKASGQWYFYGPPVPNIPPLIVPTLGFPLKRAPEAAQISQCQSDVAGTSSLTSSPSRSDDDLNADHQRLLTIVSLVLVRAFLCSQVSTGLTTRPSGGGLGGAARQDGPGLPADVGRVSSGYRTGKRPRADDGDDDSGGLHKRRAGNRLKQPEGAFSRPLACPFNKYDCRLFGADSMDSRYHACATWASVKIAHLKQHLKLHHCLPQYYCFRCCQEFKLQHDYAVHQRSEPQCATLDPPRYRERIGADLREYFELDKKNPVGTSPLTYWHKIYDTCFANGVNWRSVSPYYDGPAAEYLDQLQHFTSQNMMVIFPLVRDRLGLDWQLSLEDAVRLQQEAQQEAITRFLREIQEPSPLQLGLPPRSAAIRSVQGNPYAPYNFSSVSTLGFSAIPSQSYDPTYNIQFVVPENSQAPGQRYPQRASLPTSSLESMTEASGGSSSPTQPTTPQLGARPGPSHSLQSHHPRQAISATTEFYERASQNATNPTASTPVMFPSVRVEDHDSVTNLMGPAPDDVSNWDEHMEEVLKIAWMFEESVDNTGDVCPPQDPMF